MTKKKDKPTGPMGPKGHPGPKGAIGPDTKKPDEPPASPEDEKKPDEPPASPEDEKDDLQKEADIDRPPQAGLILALLLTSEIRCAEIVARFAANPDDGERLVQLAIRRLQRAAQNRGLSTKQYLSSLVTFIMELEGALEDC